MPIFEFQCNKCMRDFEELVFDEAAPACPHCLSTNTERLVSMPRTHNKVRSIGDSYRNGVGSSSCTSCSGGSCSSCG